MRLLSLSLPLVTLLAVACSGGSDSPTSTGATGATGTSGTHTSNTTAGTGTTGGTGGATTTTTTATSRGSTSSAGGTSTGGAYGGGPITGLDGKTYYVSASKGDDGNPGTWLPRLSCVTSRSCGTRGRGAVRITGELTEAHALNK